MYFRFGEMDGMDVSPLLIAVVLILVILIIVVQLRANYKLRRKNQIIQMQSDEIKKQIKELSTQHQMLQSALAEKQQMIGVVSHDLKGPFNRIYALLQLMNLSDTPLTSEQREYLDKIHQIVTDGIGMIRNLLDNRKLEAEEIDTRPERIDLNTFLKGLLRNYSVLAEKKKIILHHELTEAVVDCDRQMLTRIIDNLLSNAIKFSEVGRNIWVQVSKNEHTVVLMIKDEGPGLSESDQSLLYKKFQRLTPRPTGGESSTGLGLYIVKSLADKIGARISCESQLQKGTTFTLSLNIAD